MACSTSSAATSVAATPNRWIFTAEQLADTPSRKCGIDSEKEANYRQQAASLIQDMGQKLQVTQLCINTAIVYMHRFYMFHSFIKFNRTSMAGSCLFLAAKVEEQPRKLEHVVRTGYMCTHRDQPPLDVKSDLYLELAQELVINENILLQTLGFEITVDHPHTHIVKTCTMCKASKDLAQTSYFLATNSLHLTSMCLQYPPTVVACICIHLACKWSSFEIPQSNEGKAWFSYVDPEVTSAVLEEITQDFLSVLERCPSKIRKKLTNHKMCDDMSFSAAENINLNLNMNLNKRPVKSEPSASQSVSSEHSDQLPVSAASTLHATIEQTSSPGPSQLRPGPATSSSFKPTNHDRIMSSGLKVLEQVDKAEQSSAAKETMKIASGVDSVDTPTLRRVKTEASTLSTKEYFERKQREKLDREAAAAKMTQFRSQHQLIGENNSFSSHQKPVKVPETNHAGIERDLTGADVLGHADQTDALPGVVKVEPSTSDTTPSAKYTSSNSAARMVKQVDHQAQSKTHGMGDPSDQRTSNIFERMGDTNFKISKLHTSATPEGRAEVMKVEAGASTTPGRPPLSVASDMVDAQLSQNMSFLQEPHRHDRRSHGQGAPSNVIITGDIAQLKESRSRSGRHDSAGALLTSPVKSVSSDMNSLPVLTAEQRGSKRKRSTGGSEQQQSPIKLTLPVPPSSAGESSHVASPQKPRPSGSSHNRSSAAVEPLTSAGLSDSQNERIRLKLSLTDMRVKNLTNPVSSGSPTVSGVKLVLSKDKQSGEYQSGSSGSALSQSPSSGQRHNHHRHHHHEHGAQHKHHDSSEHKHHRKHHKHSSHTSVPAEYHSGDAHQHRSSSDGHRHNKYPPAATSTGTTGSSRPPPEKLSRTDATYGNGHHGNTSAALSLGRQQQSGLNSIPSTYRITSLAPPPPPPPVPCDEPSYVPPPLPPE